MIKKYLKIAIRNAIKYKATTFINIFGLSCGMAICIIIIAFVSDQLSYDKHHTKNDRLYRVVSAFDFSGTLKNLVTTPGIAGASFLNSIPEIESYVRVQRLCGDNGMIVENKGEKIEDKNLLMADSTFFDLMTYNFVYGNAKVALSGVNNVVISKKVFERLFGKVNSVGKILKFDEYGFGKTF